MKSSVDVALRVRYAETDQMGHAYYSNYLVWFEVARTNYCRQKGLVYADLEKDDGTFLPVIESHCSYRRPLRYDDRFVVQTTLAELRSRALTFEYKIVSPDEKVLFAEGFTRHVFADRDGRPKSLAREYRQLLSN